MDPHAGILNLAPSKRQRKLQKRKENKNSEKAVKRQQLKEKKERREKIEKAEKMQTKTYEERIQNKFDTGFVEYQDILNKKKFQTTENDEEFDLDLKDQNTRELNTQEQMNIIDSILKKEELKPIHKLEKLPKPTVTLNFFKHLEKQKITNPTNARSTKKSKFFAVHCDYVGYDVHGIYDSLARITMVNEFGELVFQKEIKQDHPITDYRDTGMKSIDVDAITKEDAIEQMKKIIGNAKVIGFDNKLKELTMSDISKLSKKSFKEMAKLYLGIDVKLSTTAFEKANIIFKIHQINNKK